MGSLRLTARELVELESNFCTRNFVLINFYTRVRNCNLLQLSSLQYTVKKIYKFNVTIPLRKKTLIIIRKITI